MNHSATSTAISVLKLTARAVDRCRQQSPRIRLVWTVGKVLAATIFPRPKFVTEATSEDL